MAYASANLEVKTNTGFSASYSSTTMPTLAQVEDIIDQVEGEINVTLTGIGITTPVTNATLLSYVRKYSGMGAAGLTLQRYGKSDPDFRLADWYYGKYETWIDKIVTDKDYQENIKQTGNTSYTGIYIESNFSDGTHIVAAAKSTEVSYGVEGWI